VLAAPESGIGYAAPLPVEVWLAAARIRGFDDSRGANVAGTSRGTAIGGEWKNSASKQGLRSGIEAGFLLGILVVPTARLAGRRARD
jgi:hypothetical protein